MATATKVDQVARPPPGSGFSRPAAMAIFLTRALLQAGLGGQGFVAKLDEEMELFVKQCRGCDYDLRLLSSNVCPECGLTFDFNQESCNRFFLSQKQLWFIAGSAVTIYLAWSVLSVTTILRGTYPWLPPPAPGSLICGHFAVHAMALTINFFIPLSLLIGTLLAIRAQLFHHWHRIDFLLIALLATNVGVTLAFTLWLIHTYDFEMPRNWLGL